MSLKRHWWLVVSGLLLLSFLAASQLQPRSFVLVCFSDIASVALLLATTLLMVQNALRAHGPQRFFWILIASGVALWVINLGGWAVFEVVLRREIPDPFEGDIILFFHIVPLTAAVVLRPHVASESEGSHLNTVNFLMLLVWWVFLYMFVIFPDEYVARNLSVASDNYNLLYMLENLFLLAALGAAALSAKSPWRRIYWNLLGASALYAVASEGINNAISRKVYYSGSAYDVPLIASLCWFVWVALTARQLTLLPEPPASIGRWARLWPRVTMLATLSLPLMALWALLYDPSPQLRRFRLLAALAAMLALGVLLFLTQWLLDRRLTQLLHEANQSLEDLQRLQGQVVQKEKLASLGQLVAGAAHELNNPLSAILGYTEILAGNKALSAEQTSLAQKIGLQARRTHALVSDLLSFAQQTPGEKALVDVGALLQRAVQMEQLHCEGKNIQMRLDIRPDLPPILGNANQLFQACLQIIRNAADALEEVHGGTLSVSASQEKDELVVEFSDSGPGIREPGKVFDPFYTTKAVGKGAGLGLSATYGVVQNHGGHIHCYNKAEGGALFILRFPVVREGVVSGD
jgi:signal transduction histidine kinase